MITAFYAALLSLMLIVLSILVIRNRRYHKVALGSNNLQGLQKHIRAQANFTEYTPFFIILLAVLVYLTVPDYALHILGMLFFCSRLTHAYGLIIAEHFKEDRLCNSQYRIIGMAGTFTVIGVSAMLVLVFLAIQ